MNHRILLAAAISILPLSSCGGADEAGSDAAGGLSGEEVADRASEAIRLEPGQYRATAELVSIDIPGAPAQVLDMMKQSMSGQNTTSEYCLTPEEAAKGYEEMAKNSADSQCNVKRFDVDGGDIDAEMTCKSAGGEDARMILAGTGTPTSSDMTMTMEMAIPQMGKGTMVMRAQHQRIGDCPE